MRASQMAHVLKPLCLMWGVYHEGREPYNEADERPSPGGPAMKCFIGIDQALTMTGPRGDTSPERALGLINDAAVVADDGGSIHWVGPRASLPITD